jgi:hypothetical protein
MPAVRGSGIARSLLTLLFMLGSATCTRDRAATGGTGTSTGGTSTTTTASGGAGGSSSPASGGTSGQGGASDQGGAGGQAGGAGGVGDGGASGAGGKASSGGAPASGGGAGAGGVPGNGGATSASGGTGGGGGATVAGGASGNGGAAADAGPDAPPDLPVDTGPPPIVYALPPPNQAHNQFFIPNCQSGVATSPGGGNCTPAQNACEGTKQGAQVQFLCPRFMLFSDEMAQAALDDGNAGLNYAVVGHDADTGGIDGNVTMSCCQCYQIVYQLPENMAQENGNGASAIPIPPALVVQSFNTAAGGGKNFDVFMGAGGFGAFNACDPNASQKSPSGKYLYTQFPTEGEPGSGGVNAATQLPSCSSKGLVTTATLSASACQTSVTTACGKFASASSAMTATSIRSCAESNDPNSYYHMNWKVYAKRVECPTHLTEVTGCKLSPQGLPAVNPAVTTPEKAAGDSSFKSGYTTTTMQDCCMPTCAWQNNTTGQNLSLVGNYNSFYSCDDKGVPITEPQ